MAAKFCDFMDLTTELIRPPLRTYSVLRNFHSILELTRYFEATPLLYLRGITP